MSNINYKFEKEKQKAISKIEKYSINVVGQLSAISSLSLAYDLYLPDDLIEIMQKILSENKQQYSESEYWEYSSSCLDI